MEHQTPLVSLEISGNEKCWLPSRFLFGFRKHGYRPKHVIWVKLDLLVRRLGHTVTDYKLPLDFPRYGDLRVPTRNVTRFFALPTLDASISSTAGTSKYDRLSNDWGQNWFLETAASPATTPASPTTARHELGAPLPALMLMHAALALSTTRCANGRGRPHKAVRCVQCRRLFPYCIVCDAPLYGEVCTCGFETPTCESDDEAVVLCVSDSEEEIEAGSSQQHALQPTPVPPPSPPPPELPPPEAEAPPPESSSPASPPPKSPPPTGGTGAPVLWLLRTFP